MEEDFEMDQIILDREIITKKGGGKNDYFKLISEKSPS